MHFQSSVPAISTLPRLQLDCAQTMHFQGARDTLPLSSVLVISTLPRLQLDYAQTM